MGKKARKTRWRTLTIADEHSDSEESSTTAAPSQSTPRRRYQYDSAKSTRSSSTVSENKITFNEDEYTRITTPRQDVLFKKGYLNKPKNYQTQTSTGTSTTSTGNSTGNGTPDYQSTDLEYESQFVFPNGFVDQNGIYYVNSYESYPLMVYNPQTYYPEYSNCRSKRYSTDSLAGSMSPNNEEATSQDLSGGEASNNVSDYGGQHVYNMVYPGYYVNGVCPPSDVPDGPCPADQTRRIKKRRRRKSSKSETTQDTSEYTEDETDSCDEEQCETQPVPLPPNADEPASATATDKPEKNEDSKTENEKVQPGVQDNAEISSDDAVGKEIVDTQSEAQEECQATAELAELAEKPVEVEEKHSVESPKPVKYDLKPDAEEFVPRAYRNSEIQMNSGVHFVPVPLVPFNGQNFNAAFIPPGIPINFLAPQNFVSFVPNEAYLPNSETKADNDQRSEAENTENSHAKVACQKSNTGKDVANKEHLEKPVSQNMSNKTIDIATIVSKLEEAAKEQEEKDTKKANGDVLSSPTKRIYENKQYRTQKYKNNPGYRRTHYINPQNSPQRYSNDNSADRSVAEHNSKGPLATRTQQNEDKRTINSPSKNQKTWRLYSYQNGSSRWPQNRSPKTYYKTATATEAKDCKIPNNRNYSETLKYKTTNETTGKTNSTTPNETTEPPKIPPSYPKPSNQWINVSSRKKRKTKNLEENEASFDDRLYEEEHSQTELFESYDVSLLVDVVPTKKTDDETKDTVKEVVINDAAQNETDNVESNNVELNIQPISDVGNEVMAKSAEPEEKVEPSLLEEKVDAEEKAEAEIEPNKSKKKSKKGTQKPVTKRVFITDISLPDTTENIKSPIKKVAKKVEKTEEKPHSLPTTPVQEKMVKESPPSTTNEEERKKNKKKKKKRGKTVLSCSSLSSSSNTINVEDTYDIFLESALISDSGGKTNTEVSEELDKIIQRGLYSNLEEKIKSLNIDESDGFFKSMFSTLSSREPSIEKTGYVKTPDFTNILQSTKTLFEPGPVSEENNSKIKNVTNILPDLGSQDEDGFFLENPDFNDALRDHTETNGSEETNRPGNKSDVEVEPKTLYPITQAVKDWMCRTREATPDVEILKSPDTIYKEFCESVSETETELSDSENHISSVDEITVYTNEPEFSLREENRDQQDVENWEDMEDCTEDVESSQNGPRQCLVEEETHIERGEDVLEVFGSRYGKNEDLNLQHNVKDKMYNSNRIHLPYRAICCNIL